MQWETLLLKGYKTNNNLALKLQEMGFIPGSPIMICQNIKKWNLVILKSGNLTIGIRREDFENMELEPIKDEKSISCGSSQ